MRKLECFHQSFEGIYLEVRIVFQATAVGHLPGGNSNVSTSPLRIFTLRKLECFNQSFEGIYLEEIRVFQASPCPSQSM